MLESLTVDCGPVRALRTVPEGVCSQRNPGSRSKLHAVCQIKERVQPDELERSVEDQLYT